jgi:hypothetical protein
MQSASVFLRPAPGPLTAREIDGKARAIWENIAAETGTRHTHALKVARLYNVCRDIQIAVAGGARFKTVVAVLDLIATTIARSFGMREPRGA